MGYRSDVRIVTSKRGFKELKKFNDKYLKERNEQYSLLDQMKIKYEDSNVIYFGWDFVKWYEGSYPSVDAICEGLNHLEEKDLSYRYARLGEDMEDYEESYYESTKEKEQDLEYPTLIREFDDNYFVETMNRDYPNITSNQQLLDKSEKKEEHEL